MNVYYFPGFSPWIVHIHVTLPEGICVLRGKHMVI